MALNGDLLRVSSFFDVFFEVSLTDVDPVNNYQGPSGGLPDGVTLGPIPNGTSASVQFDGTCVADLSKVNYGCLPPTGNAYIGHFKVVIPLGFDINGNAADDVIQFTLATHNVGAVTNTSVSGANALDTFNTTLDLEGLVQDAQTDPPFTLQLTGPTTASQNIVVPAVVPEPGSAGLLLIALAMLRAGRRRARR